VATDQKKGKGASGSRGDALTPKQQRFVEEYLIDLNATQAAIRAGYSEKTAGSQAFDLLKKPEINDAVVSAMKEREKRTEITQDMVLKELAKIGFSNMQDYMRVGPDGDPYLDFSNLSRDQAAALAEVTVEDFKDGRGEDARDVRKVKFKLADKRAALVDIGRHLGMFDKDSLTLKGDEKNPVHVATKVVLVPPKQAAQVQTKPVQREG
jgi:phage terminase small subunit